MTDAAPAPPASAPATWTVGPRDASAAGPGARVWPPAAAAPPRKPPGAGGPAGEGGGGEPPTGAPPPRAPPCDLRPHPPRADPLCLRGWGKETAGVLSSRSSSLFKRALPAPPAGPLRGQTPSECGDETRSLKNKRVPTGLRESPLYAPPPAMAPGPRLGPVPLGRQV